MSGRADSGPGLLPDPQAQIFYAPYATPDGGYLFYPMIASPAMLPMAMPMPVPMMPSMGAPAVSDRARATSFNEKPTVTGTPTLRPVDKSRRRGSIDSISPVLSYGHLPVLAPPHPYPGYFVVSSESIPSTVPSLQTLLPFSGTSLEQTDSCDCAHHAPAAVLEDTRRPVMRAPQRHRKDIRPVHTKLTIQLDSKDEFPDLTSALAKPDKKKIFGKFQKKKQID